MLDCPFPFQKYPVVTLAHGAGGRFTHHLIEDIFAVAMGSEVAEHDGALLNVTGDLAFTTDSYVVNPLFFPGGDIGKLAVTGTCNDLAMCGAKPEFLSCGWIIEEGFPTRQLFELACSMAAAASEVGARIVTGDTKVVERGAGDGVYLNVTGVGLKQFNSHPQYIQDGDQLILSGDVGRHGAAILTQREDLQLESVIESDCGHLWPALQQLHAAGLTLHCLRDLTRGGLATALVELSQSCGLRFSVQRNQIPVREDVRSACELFGLDPLYMANEGRMVLVVSPDQVEPILASLGKNAVSIGIVETGAGVNAINEFGGEQVLDMLSGEQLPRIC